MSMSLSGGQRNSMCKGTEVGKSCRYAGWGHVLDQIQVNWGLRSQKRSGAWAGQAVKTLETGQDHELSAEGNGEPWKSFRQGSGRV